MQVGEGGGGVVWCGGEGGEDGQCVWGKVEGERQVEVGR